MSRKGDQYIRIELNRKQFVSMLALLAVCAVSLKLSADNVTVTTSYPSPTGIYKNMTTTQDTVLARDQGNVGIGTTTPGSKLSIIGDASLSGQLMIGVMASDPGTTPCKAGSLYYNTTMNLFKYCDGTGWQMLGTSRRWLVTKLYKDVLDRAPDSSGALYWMSGTLGSAQIVAGFLNSTEFNTKYAANKDFVDELYKCLFGRDADSDGEKFWMNQLSNGVNRAAVVSGFMTSQECAAGSGEPPTSFCYRMANY